MATVFERLPYDGGGSAYKATFPVPARIADRLSREATAEARRTGPRSKEYPDQRPRANSRYGGGRGDHGVDHLQPVRGAGVVGVRVPDRYGYLLFQEHGTRSFVMHGLAGKTIPIRLPSGELIFRVAVAGDKPGNIGRRKITARDSSGRLQSQKIAWWHPGIKGSHFIENATRRTIQRWMDRMPERDRIELLRQVPGVEQFLGE